MFTFKFLPPFLKDLKKYKKKFPSIKKDLIKTLNLFNIDNAVNLGKNNYKIRLKSSDIPKGKNKSFRIIIHVQIHQNKAYPLALYFKGDKENLNKKELTSKFKDILKYF